MKENNDFFNDDILDDTGELELDEEYEYEPDFELRAVLLSKNDMLALLSLKTSAEGCTVVRVDPRQNAPSAQEYDDAAAAEKWFARSISTSRKNGWNVIFDGEPLWG